MKHDFNFNMLSTDNVELVKRIHSMKIDGIHIGEALIDIRQILDTAPKSEEVICDNDFISEMQGIDDIICALIDKLSKLSRRTHLVMPECKNK
jgi:predicted Mrr-cat superfamily restriction endonuclease